MKKTLIATLLLSFTWFGGSALPARASDENLQVQMLMQLFRLPQPEWLAFLNENRGLLDSTFFERVDSRIRWGVENNQIDDALRMSIAADMAMKANGQKGRYRMTMVYAFLKANNDGMAKDVLMNILLTDPGDQECELLMAILLKAEGETIEALNRFKKLADAGYHKDECLYNIGVIYILMQKYAEGEKALEDCIALNPNFADASKFLEKYRQTRPKFAPEGVSLNKLPLPKASNVSNVSEEARQKCQTFFDEGEAFMKAGEIAKAKAAYGRALEQNPAHVKSLAYLGALLYRQGDLDGAIEHLRKAVGYAPKDREALHYLGYAYERRFDTKGSAADLEEAALFFQQGKLAAPQDHQFQSELDRVNGKRNPAANR
jgi:tetratricopeptide (TPR) repeat protein